MNSKQLECVYSIFDRIFAHKIMFAIGGQYALIKQGIIPEMRPINDLDINIFSSGSVHDIAHSVAEAREMINRACVIFNHGTKYNIRLELEGIRRRQAYDEEVDESDPINFNTDDDHLNAVTSLSIKILERKIPTYRPRPSTLIANLLDAPEVPVNPPTITTNAGTGTYVATNSGEMYVSGLDVPNSMSYSGAPSNYVPMRELDVSTYFNAKRMEAIIELLPLINSFPDRKLKIDLFSNVFDNNREKLIWNEHGAIVGYWGILNAKRTYCANPRCSQESFDKHLTDLIRSYSTKRIQGINYREDIQFLINNRRNGQSQQVT